jgi:hypothetical protein
MPSLSRRAVLAGGVGVVLLAACGKSSGGGADEDEAQPGLQVARFFPDGTQAVDAPQRYPFGLGDETGVMGTGPAELVASIRGEDGAVVAEGIRVARHDQGLERAYWPLVTELPVGIYEVTFTADGQTLPASAVSVRDPSEVTVVRPSTPMPNLATPTTADARGVNPVCTRAEPCPLHDTSLDEALAAGPVALLVGTPAYCATGICGPVLEVLLGARGDYPAITFLHAEIYTDDTLKTTSPTVQGLGMTFEPALFLVGADGVVKERLDVIYDEVELTAALTRLAA